MTPDRPQLWHIGVALSRLLNTLTGGAYDQSFSTHLAERTCTNTHNSLTLTIYLVIEWWEPGHCERSLSEHRRLRDFPDCRCKLPSGALCCVLERESNESVR